MEVLGVSLTNSSTQRRRQQLGECERQSPKEGSQQKCASIPGSTNHDITCFISSGLGKFSMECGEMLRYEVDTYHTEERLPIDVFGTIEMAPLTQTSAVGFLWKACQLANLKCYRPP